MYNCSTHLYSTATGKPSSCRRSAWAPVSWCTRWRPPCATRSTCMASGPSAGTQTRARSCRTTTTTRRAPSSPLNGRSPISYPPSSNCSTRCIRRDCWSSASPTVLRPEIAAGTALLQTTQAGVVVNDGADKGSSHVVSPKAKSWLWGWVGAMGS